jgi:hypothetical protein
LRPPRCLATIPANVISLAGFTRRRKALVAAFVPYLLLSVFVDFVHLHRLITGPVATSALSAHANTEVPGGTKLPETSCAICQWQRAGTGMQASVTDEPAHHMVAALVVLAPSPVPLRVELGVPDFRGPPPALSL